MDFFLVLEKILELDVFSIFFENMFCTFEYLEYDRCFHKPERKRAENVIDTSFVEEFDRFLRSERINHYSVLIFILGLKFFYKRRINFKNTYLGTLSYFLEKSIRKSPIPCSKLHDMNIMRQIHRTDHFFVQKSGRRTNGSYGTIISKNTLQKSHKMKIY